MGGERKYAKITLKVREELIDLVHQQGFTFKKAADSLNINQSTARMIVRKYEKSGVLFEKKEEHKRRIEVEKALEEYKEKNEVQNKVESEAKTADQMDSLASLWFVPALCQLLAHLGSAVEPQ